MNKTEIRQKLLDIQGELSVPKNQRNSFGNYNYRSCEDILEALKPLLKKHGVVLIISDEIVRKGDRYYVRAEAVIKNTEGEESLFVRAYAREALVKKGMDEAQITGSASSYARKYALNGLFAIDDTKDADSTNTHGKEMPTKEIAEKMEEALNFSKKLSACKVCGSTGKYHKTGCTGAIK